MDKSLEDKAILIKNSKYVLVSDRVIYFNETYPNWMIKTDRTKEWEIEVVKATIIPDFLNPERFFTGHSQAKWWDWFINKSSALENAETSAVGRALAMMWIWVIDSIASVDELKKAETNVKKDMPMFKDWKSLQEHKTDFKENVDKINTNLQKDRIPCKSCDKKIPPVVFNYKDLWLCRDCQTKHFEKKTAKVEELVDDTANDLPF